MSGCHDSESNDHDERINGLENIMSETRLIELERWRLQVERELKTIHGIITNMDANEINYSKKPYRCPLCDGFGKQLHLITQEVSECKACNGIGIVWG
jgi:hypothetical protein